MHTCTVETPYLLFNCFAMQSLTYPSTEAPVIGAQLFWKIPEKQRLTGQRILAQTFAYTNKPFLRLSFCMGRSVNPQVWWRQAHKSLCWGSKVTKWGLGFREWKSILRIFPLDLEVMQSDNKCTWQSGFSFRICCIQLHAQTKLYFTVITESHHRLFRTT